jgi:hypothetical protein
MWPPVPAGAPLASATGFRCIADPPSFLSL